MEIAQRAKKLLRSWQGLLNTSQADPPTAAAPNGESKPRLILKVKLNSPLSKRKRDADVPAVHGTHAKRRKTQVIETPTPISPVKLLETAASLPRLKTTQQLLLEMQRSEPSVLATQTSTINAILQKKIIDETLHEAVKIDYSALHKGKDLRHTKLVSTRRDEAKRHRQGRTCFGFSDLCRLELTTNDRVVQCHVPQQQSPFPSLF